MTNMTKNIDFFLLVKSQSLFLQMKDMEDDKEELVLPGENVRPKGKIGIRHLVVFMGTYDTTDTRISNSRR